MPETVSPGEVAHTLSHQHGKTAGEKHAERIEILEAILLAIVAVATAWSGYQTGRWDGDQAHLYGLSNKERAAENRAATRSGQQIIYDTSTFGFWLQEKAAGDHEAAALFERRFRPEYRVAFNAWVKTDPFHNPRAPVAPIRMPQYHNATAEEAAKHRRASLRLLRARDEGARDRRPVSAEHRPARDGALSDRARAEVQGRARPPVAARRRGSAPGGRALLRVHVSDDLTKIIPFG